MTERRDTRELAYLVNLWLEKSNDNIVVTPEEIGPVTIEEILEDLFADAELV